MVLYRRNLVHGGTFFFTVTLLNRNSSALVEHINFLREAWIKAKDRIPHKIIASVVLPEHLHVVIQLEHDQSDYPKLWQEIKKGFTRRVETIRKSPRRIDGYSNIWQRRYWEHTIRDQADLNAHIDYIHYNPVKHGYVQRVRDWPHSSFHRYVAKGILPLDWGNTPMDFSSLSTND
jgi:putative transposase